MYPPDQPPAGPKPARLDYDSRVAVPPTGLPLDTPPVPLRVSAARRAVQAVIRLPGLVVIGALLLIVPSLIYAAVDPFFGGHSTDDALKNSLTATLWALPAAALLLLLRWIPVPKRRRPADPVTKNLREKSSSSTEPRTK
jgi:hypothetical protein